MRREKQESVGRAVGRQVGSASVQLFDDDTDVLKAEVPLLFDEISKRTARSLPSHNAVEAGESFSRRTQLGLWHPLLQSRPIQVEIRRGVRPNRHVQALIMFFNNEKQ